MPTHKKRDKPRFASRPKEQRKEEKEEKKRERKEERKVESDGSQVLKRQKRVEESESIPEKQCPPITTEEASNVYYEHIFPKHMLWQYLSLNCTNGRGVECREFAIQTRVFYKRHLRFDEAGQWTDYIKESKAQRVDVGGVFGPWEGRTAVIEREIQFDVDLTDYVKHHIITTNLSEPHSEGYLKSWKVAQVGARILHKILKERYGFKLMLGVFSGMKGFHVRCSDRTGFTWSNEERKKFVRSFSIMDAERNMCINMYHKGESGSNYEKPDYVVHGIIEDALSVIESGDCSLFLEIAEEQGWFKEENIEHTLFPLVMHDKELISSVRAALKEFREKAKDSARISARHEWDVINTAIGVWTQKRNSASSIRARMRDFSDARSEKPASTRNDTYPKSPRLLEMEMMLFLLFPRIDVNVTTGVNHLLKCPLSIHPKSGFVSELFDLEDIQNFSPKQVHTVQEVVRLHDAYKAGQSGDPLLRSKKVLRNLINKAVEAGIERTLG